MDPTRRECPPRTGTVGREVFTGDDAIDTEGRPGSMASRTPDEIKGEPAGPAVSTGFDELFQIN